MPRKRIDLTFPPSQAGKPIIFHLVKDYGLTPNILRAQIQPGQQGRMLVELTGGKKEFERGLAFLEREGLSVREAASDICLDDEACVVCGLCTSVCKPGALALAEGSFELEFDKDECVYCEACVVACPRRAITLRF